MKILGIVKSSSEPFNCDMMKIFKLRPRYLTIVQRTTHVNASKDYSQNWNERARG